MARRFPTFVVLLPLMAACATTAPNADVDVVTSPSGEVYYLQGVTTRYSVRLDEMRSTHSRIAESRLPHAVVAGDASITVAGSVFRRGNVFTLDLIVRNHGEEPIEIDRAHLEAFDDAGDPLIAMLDWEDGPDYGLRALQGRDRGYNHMGTDHQQGQAGTSEAPRATVGTTKGVVEPLAGASDMAQSVADTPMDITWISELAKEQKLVTLPAVVVLEPGDAEPYWAYWKGHDVELPITVSLRVGKKRMLLRFDAPGTEVAR